MVQVGTICKYSNKKISQMSINSQTEINILWHIYVMEYFTAMRRNKLLLHPTVQLSPTNMFNERR